MALAASPPSQLPVMPTDPMTLDHEISQVRAEIQALTQRRNVLASSLLSSSRVRSQLARLNAKTPASNDEAENLSKSLENAAYQAQCDAHRFALGVTAFRFNDPSPECQPLNPLLGIRIDIGNRHGQNEEPYYLFCRRVSLSSQEIRIHRHTLPAFVPLESYEKKYLPITDEGYGGSDDMSDLQHDTSQLQDLESLVAEVRSDLVSYTLRRDAIDQLREELGLPQLEIQPKVGNANGGREDNEDEDDQDEDEEDEDEPAQSGKYDIDDIRTDGPDCFIIKIVWSDDRVGRIKISKEGKILRAIVIGANGDRVSEEERILAEGQPLMYEMHARLEKLHRRTLIVERNRRRGNHSSSERQPVAD